jgi:hypothetical protein
MVKNPGFSSSSSSFFFFFFFFYSWALKMGPTDCHETSVRNYHYSLRDNPEERNVYLLRGWSLKSGTIYIYIYHNVGRLIIHKGGPASFHSSGFTFTQRTSLLWEPFDDNIISYPWKTRIIFCACYYGGQFFSVCNSYAAWKLLLYIVEQSNTTLVDINILRHINTLRLHVSTVYSHLQAYK